MLNLSYFLLFGSTLVFADLLGIPTVPFKTASDKTFDLSSIRTIAVDPQFVSARDDNGWTLIPPTLKEFADIFAEDLKQSTTPHVTVQECGVEANGIFLTISNDTKFTDAAGRFTSEGYKIDVSDHGINITGASPLGVWWGTRTVLQQAILHNGKLSLGSGVDSPGWNTRGIFLDAGRHYYPPSFLVEMCSWISFWKQNTFHLHLSDNLYNNVDIYDRERQLDLYARFRLWSDDPAVAGLNKHRNESYTREDFDYIQSSCASRGVTVIPEIEAPGHALVISQWKPELGLDGALDLLNISYPETIPAMQSIWKTFLPWFHSKTVHIGADEYADADLSTYELAEAYNKFVNAMNEYISAESGKEMRIWGTYPPQSNYTNNIAKNVTIQHWEFFEDNPLFDYINSGISVINSDDGFYMVQKYSESYPQQLNRTRIFHGNPAGGPFAPNIFDTKNATNNPPRDSRFVPGHIAAQWNDYGYNTSTYLEAYYEWRDLLPALADKQWGGTLEEKDYDELFASLQPKAPAQNLDRTIPSKSSTILKYDFQNQVKSRGQIKDLSENNYNGQTNCSLSNQAFQFQKQCKVSTPLTSKGMNYTLSFTLKQTSPQPGPLFTGPDSELRSGNGSSSAIMLVSGGNAFALNYSLPVGKWVDAKLIGRGNQTFFAVDGGDEMEFKTRIGINGLYTRWTRMAIVAPLQTIGGGSWEGLVKSVELVDYA
ncbi:glycoside hydrolase family 20 protein [Acrodontium crateriforme]|uniref:beta-N-acetylhexosaminidase n=1 Tax=Acrodontium crateriforme TaxID=150365 RepID=A0AAQ3M8U7_9PEZI|nr:glycoside hydrolase family 20 protein [Acrodontium crateriforme]